MKEVFIKYVTLKVLEALIARFPFLRVQILNNFATIILNYVVKIILVETKLVFIDIRKREDFENLEKAITNYEDSKKLEDVEDIKIKECEVIDSFRRFVKFG